MQVNGFDAPYLELSLNEQKKAWYALQKNVSMLLIWSFL